MSAFLASGVALPGTAPLPILRSDNYDMVVLSILGANTSSNAVNVDITVSGDRVGYKELFKNNQIAVGNSTDYVANKYILPSGCEFQARASASGSITMYVGSYLVDFP
tara:strand:+ start:2328 stop:2651 length:324 start_codon:yes stop_codon:yes gene_type:complete